MIPWTVFELSASWRWLDASLEIINAYVIRFIWIKSVRKKCNRFPSTDLESASKSYQMTNYPHHHCLFIRESYFWTRWHWLRNCPHIDYKSTQIIGKLALFNSLPAVLVSIYTCSCVCVTIHCRYYLLAKSYRAYWSAILEFNVG